MEAYKVFHFLWVDNYEKSPRLWRGLFQPVKKVILVDQF